VSIDLANDHMYVAGSTTIDSFEGGRRQMSCGGRVRRAGWWERYASHWQHGTGGCAQQASLLVTLKKPIRFGNSRYRAPSERCCNRRSSDAVSAPAGTLTPFGFSVYPDGTAVITLAP